MPSNSEFMAADGTSTNTGQMAEEKLPERAGAVRFYGFVVAAGVTCTETPTSTVLAPVKSVSTRSLALIVPAEVFASVARKVTGRTCTALLSLEALH
jgi:hypothetical protein